MISLEAQIEAILFKLNEPTELSKIADILGRNEAEITEALDKLKTSFGGRGVNLLQNGSEYSLVTSREVAGIIEQMQKDELKRDIGRAGLETLSIVLYKGPLSRREVDYIRGVNSTFILRSLMVRGLVSRTDDRQPLYKATSELLAFLGASSIEELPEFDAVKREIEAVENSKNDER